MSNNLFKYLLIINKDVGIYIHNLKLMITKFLFFLILKKKSITEILKSIFRF